MKERSGATLVLVTHDERLANMTERVIRMGDGRILSENFQAPAVRVAAQ